MTPQSELVLGQVVRDERAAVLAGVLRTVRDVDLAEDAVQEAIADALRGWPRTGIPDRPAAWLTTVARRRAIDRVRRDRAFADRAHLLVDDDAAVDPDHDLLSLIFTCCHPDLPVEAQVALTLRTVAGLTTEEIARAFLVGHDAMRQRLARAKARIRDDELDYRVPEADELPERLSSVLAVVYLVFNEGYAAASGEHLTRPPLVREAIDLGERLAGLVPDEPEVLGLVALMGLHDARRVARTTATGELVLLEDQDRSRWDRGAIDEAVALLARAETAQRPGRYQLEAAIAAVHATAPTFDATDWRAIVTLYDALRTYHPTAVVELNRAVAVSMAAGPTVALELLDALTDRLDDYHLFHATRGELLDRAGRPDEARSALTRALHLAGTEAERHHLSRRLSHLAQSGH